MEAAWNDTPHARFWRRLLNENVDALINDPDKFLLRHMRHDHQMVRDYQKRYGSIFKERGLNLYELIARACGEVWDNEDEEKGGVLAKKAAPMEQREIRNAVSLDHTREIGVRERKIQGNVVQAGDGRREKDLQEGQGCRRERGPRGGAQETAAAREKKKAEGGGRVKSQHTTGLGNVEEGRIAEKRKPAKKPRQRKRPVLGKAYQAIN